MGPEKHYYAVVYYRPYRELRERAFPSQLHKTRDGLVHLELSPLFQKAGFTYAGTILNVPDVIRRDGPHMVRDCQVVPNPGDLLVLGTRPPLDDGDSLARRSIDRSELPIEARLLEEVRKVFRLCRRNAVVFQDLIGVPLEYRSVQFGEFHGAPMKSPLSSKNSPPSTVGYCLWLPAANERSWHALAVFGMGGTESLVFAHLLRTQFAETVAGVLRSRHRRLLVVRFLLPTAVPCPLLVFPARELDVRMVADLTLD